MICRKEVQGGLPVAQIEQPRITRIARISQTIEQETAEGFADSFSGPFPKKLPKRSINRSIGISPATNTALVTSTNCNFNYWTLRSENDGDLVLVCDRNGLGNASNSLAAWGGNHDGKGGNYVKVAGEGKWVGTNEILNMPGAAFDLSRSTNSVGVVTNN